MKKRIIFIFILGAAFILVSCSHDRKKETNQPYNSIADDVSSEADLPEGAKIIEDPKDFKPVTYEQPYNIETDSNLCTDCGITTDGNNIYFHYFNEIEVMDTETKSYLNICNKPQCTHTFEEEDCNGYFPSVGIQYFQGALYTVGQENIWEGDEFIGNRIVLYKLSLDGSTKEKMNTLATVYQSDMVKMPNSDMRSNSVYWVIHRDYIYYVYDIGTSGLADNTCYNNMSNYVSRMKIGKDEKREYIMPLKKGSRTAETDLWGYGPYVYFMDIERETGNGIGNLYRFNTESGEVEKLPFQKRMIRTYTAWNDFLLYTNIDADSTDTGLYKYNKNGSTEKILDFADYDNRFGTLEPIFLSRDKQYIYAISCVDKEKSITKCLLFDCEGNYISSFDCCVEGNKTAAPYSIDDKLMLMKTLNFDWYYFDREELKTGEIHPVRLTPPETEED